MVAIPGKTNPCGNCKDSSVKCRRDRPTLPRKPRRNISEQVSDTIEELKERLAVLENTVSHLVSNGATAQISSHQSPISTGRIAQSNLPNKRSIGTAFGKNVQAGVEQSSSGYSTPLFSVPEAQEAIQKEIESAPNLSDRRRAVFNAAINSLKQGLDALEGESKLSYGSLESSGDALQSPTIPPPELIHWILQRARSSQETPMIMADNV
ncbi:hypothetical protein BDZ45DRAFT_743300 [Acephala macrosclerotiorum]|nr:hypothetical protein BDZ45DRAFT_743300 [Acephala macrosclerotiorum]